MKHVYQYTIYPLQPSALQRTELRRNWEKSMSEPIVFGFPRSTFVQIVRLVLPDLTGIQASRPAQVEAAE